MKKGATKKDVLSSDQCATLLKALADKERLRIIQLLRDGPLSVTEIGDRLRLEIANASHHLGVLRRAGLVFPERRGKQIIYEVSRDVLQKHQAECDHLNLGCCRLEIPTG